MKKLFSERYKDLIKDNNFIGKFEYSLKRKLICHLDIFNERLTKSYSRYDSYMIDTYARLEVISAYWELKGWNGDDIPQVDEEWFYKKEPYELFDIIELWYDVLSVGEKTPFATALNEIMELFDVPWRLFDGKLIKIDSQQFEQDLRNRTLYEMQELVGFVPEFRNSYLELLEANDDLTKGNYKHAILNACKSYESVLKVILNVNRGNADKLSKDFAESKYMNELPPNVKKTGFQEKVLMSLPFLRNNIAGHGDGKESCVVTYPLAKLCVNLASSLNTYILEQYRANTLLERLEEKDESEDEEDWLPF